MNFLTISATISDHSLIINPDSFLIPPESQNPPLPIWILRGRKLLTSPVIVQISDHSYCIVLDFPDIWEKLSEVLTATH